MQHHGDGRPLILAFGDSLTAGYGLPRDQSFPHQLQALLRERHPGAAVHNAGVSGDTTAGGRARLPGMLSRLTAKPDLAIVELGANDLLRGFAPERTRDNLSWIVGELGRCAIPVLIAGMMAPPFLGAFAKRFNGLFADVAAAHGVPLDPFFLQGVMGDRSLTLADGIHPNGRAIGIVARRLLPLVDAALRGEGFRVAA